MSEKKKRSGFWRWVRRIWLVLLFSTLVFVGWLWWAQQATPSYWEVIDTSDPVYAQEADRFEQWSSATFSKSRPLGEPWRFEITQDQANGWLATRLDLWEANRGWELPEEMMYPMVAVREGEMILAVEVHAERGRKILGITVDAAANPEGGPVTLEITDISIGRIKVSYERAMKTFEDYNMPQMADALVSYREQLQEAKLVFSLADGREVEILDIAFHHERAVLTCRTLRP